MQRIRHFRKLILSIWFGITAQSAFAEVVVVVSAKSPLAAMAEDQIANVFLGRAERLPGGAEATPIDLAEGSAVRAEFYRLVTGKSAAQLKVYWSKLIFTGNAQPPREVGDASALKRLLGAKPLGIGYLDSKDVDASVRVILNLR